MRTHKPVTLVLCEGKGDKLVMESLAKHAGIENGLEFESYDSASNLRAYLKNLKARAEFARGEYAKILVTRDADTSYEDAWKSVKDSIQHVFGQIVENPGDWIELESEVKLAAWVVPGPDQTGMIETLCLDAARAHNPDQFTCLNSFIDCLEAQWGHRPHEKVRFTLWTIIAQGKTAQDRLSIPYAIQNLDFNWDNAAYDSLKDLFRDISQ